MRRKRGGFQECPNCGALKESVVYVLLSAHHAIFREASSYSGCN